MVRHEWSRVAVFADGISLSQAGDEPYSTTLEGKHAMKELTKRDVRHMEQIRYAMRQLPRDTRRTDMARWLGWDVNLFFKRFRRLFGPSKI